MSKRNFLGARTDRPGRRRPSRRATPVGLSRLELLDSRVLPAVTATFSAATGVLRVVGDALNNNITVSRNAGGTLFVNGGAVRIRGARPTVNNTNLIQVFGQNGNDNVTLNEANGALPRANLFGGNGNDRLIGGSKNDQLNGDAGNDTLFGRAGVDRLIGGLNDDIQTGGTGNDQVFGQAGDDRTIWNQGDGSDLNESGAGNDTVVVNGGDGDETFSITANGARVRFERTTAVAFTLDIGTTENLVLNARGGNDTITAGDGLAALIDITIDAGAGNDTVQGGDGDDTILAGDGNDFVDGGRGDDTAFLGAGDDTFRWDPGDGDDVVEGQAGSDTLLFNGAGAAEVINIAADGPRVRFTRDVANIVIDLDDVEGILFNALGGADAITVGDVTGTDLTRVELDLSGVAGTGTGDTTADTVTVNGTAGNDTVNVTGTGTGFTVDGLQALVEVKGSDGVTDSLVLNTLAGNDTVNAGTLPATVVKLTVDGGAGDDTIQGGDGNDSLLGGDGDDFIDGGRGNDTGTMGAGDDTFRWDPGDGNDIIEGQAGFDTMLFNGAGAAEIFNVSAVGPRVRFTRDVANIVMDLDDVEGITLNALGGPDTVTVDDVTGTDLRRVDVDLANPAGSGTGDGAADAVIVNGTGGQDVIAVAGDGTGVAVTGLTTSVNIKGAEAANDRLTINTLGGDDVMVAAALNAGAIPLTANGGEGNDVLIGGANIDTLNGEAGDDVIIGRGGVDILDGGGGTNTVIQD